MSDPGRIALYTDEDVDGRVAKQLQRLGYDVVSSHAASNSGKGLPDEWQLEYAVNNQRVILSHNVSDFYRLAREWHIRGREHYGIVVASQIELGALILRCAQHIDRISAEDHHNILMYLG